jgi:hypothetical protein
MALKSNNPENDSANKALTEEQLKAKEELLLEQRMAAAQALEEERARVMQVRENIDRVAEGAADGEYYIDYDTNPDDPRAEVPGAGVVPKKTFSWLKGMGGAACSTYACSIMREAGVTVPKSVGPQGITINGVKYKPGDKMPIIPGNLQFDTYANKLGFQLRPPGSLPEEGDVTRAGYGTGRTSHSTIQTGEGQNVYNSGQIGLGLKRATHYADDFEFEPMSEENTQKYLTYLEDRISESEDYPVRAQEYRTMAQNVRSRMGESNVIYPTRLMQYVGDLPKLQKQYREAAQALGPERTVSAIKPVKFNIPKPTAQLPTKIEKFFNRNK